MTADDCLEAELRRVIAAADPIPEMVTLAAHDALRRAGRARPGGLADRPTIADRASDSDHER